MPSLQPHIRMLALAALVLHPGTAASVPQPVIAPPAGWVAGIDPPPWDDDGVSSSYGSAYCLLVDQQLHLASKSSYLHLAIKVLNHEGVQQLSDITFNYDPSYETLTLHSLQLRRGGTVIDKLKTDRIRTFQRETNLEMRMYDGSLTASINLSDVRIGDVIEYAVTNRGQHPAYGGHNFGLVRLDAGIPIELRRIRLIAPDVPQVNIRFADSGTAPVIARSPGETVYEWTHRKLRARDMESYVPAWYFTRDAIRFTDYTSWHDVARWALPLFELSPAEKDRLHAVADEITFAPDTPAAILKAIRFVQNDIRYLALEEGMSAYLPHPPAWVIAHRYGDCKDKALLLVALLQKLGVEAHPMLVNTAAPRNADDFTMSPGDFDHCVVAFKYGGRDRFVDPTLSHQGGDLDHLYFPDFQRGLIVAPQTEKLTALPTPDCGSARVAEHYLLNDAGGATLSVVSEYRGRLADMQRQYFATNDLGDIQKGYIAYYATLYPGVSAAGDVLYNDAERDAENLFVVQEKYELSDIAVTDLEDSTARHFELRPLELSELVHFESSPGRTMPYEVGRVSRRVEFVVDGMDSWYAEPEEKLIKGERFRYRKTATVEEGRMQVVHEYERTGSYIDAESVAEFVAKHNQIRENLSSVLVTVPDVAGAGGRIRWGSIAFIVVLAAAAAWGARMIYVRYDPEPKLAGMEVERAIGGWLIVPCIGLVIMTLQNLKEFAGVVIAFSGSIVSGSEVDWFGNWFAMAFSTVALAANGLLLVLFYRRRTSAPRVWIIHMAAMLVVLILLAGTGDTTGLIFQQIVAVAIWTPYFLRSRRVHRTFVARGPRYRTQPAPEAAELEYPGLL